ncbi:MULTISPECIES: PAS domain-containing protein [unclassified Arthrobacter]|uniref:PAS domain-containing protein n=1 Tax=unclassified Arthrobacter TaxID=235627 RepID=UPI002DFFB43B|nr:MULTISPECIES: PAS domain-containing protein [unclassified Arthrobacter]MEC5189739.1 PAS domain S-box-containing protein [Arthrobacter sp. MP_M4]MEC5204881.1 PAS domain S-box-containing protein [Arthrobacter sp. MP_M7]
MSEATAAAVNYRQLFHQAPAGYVVAGVDGAILAANATLCAWVGVGALDGTRLQDLMPAGDRLMYRTQAGPKLERDGHFSELSIELLGADGQRRPVLLSVTRTTDGPEPRDLMIFFGAPSGGGLSVNWPVRTGCSRTLRRRGPDSCRKRATGPSPRRVGDSGWAGPGLPR